MQQTNFFQTERMAIIALSLEGIPAEDARRRLNVKEFRIGRPTCDRTKQKVICDEHGRYWLQDR